MFQVTIDVVLNYSDGDYDYVTAWTDFVPRHVKSFDPATDTNVVITYTEDEQEFSCNLTLVPKVLTGLVITTKPTKRFYSEGETISYDGLNPFYAGLLTFGIL